MIRVCFVCLGNICRSPTAHGILEHLVEEAGLADKIYVDSAGTAGYHVGERADSRSREAALRHGIELRSRARQFEAGDFERFNYVLAMDHSNYQNLEGLAPHPQALSRLYLFRSFDPASSPTDIVPDPYYGDGDGFETVFQICLAGCRGLLEHIRREHQP